MLKFIVHGLSKKNDQIAMLYSYGSSTPPRPDFVKSVKTTNIMKENKEELSEI